MFKFYIALFKVQHFFDHRNIGPLSAVVTLHTAGSTRTVLHYCVHRVYLCVACDSHGEKVTVPCTASASWYLYRRRTAFTARYELNFYTSIDRFPLLEQFQRLYGIAVSEFIGRSGCCGLRRRHAVCSQLRLCPHRHCGPTNTVHPTADNPCQECENCTCAILMANDELILSSRIKSNSPVHTRFNNPPHRTRCAQPTQGSLLFGRQYCNLQLAPQVISGDKSG
jgi:hypothetical protein